MSVNAAKLKSMGSEKVAEACDIHARAYHRHAASGNTALMALHRELLHVCCNVAVVLELEKRGATNHVKPPAVHVYFE